MRDWNQFDASPYIKSKGAAGYCAKYMNKRKADFDMFTGYIPFYPDRLAYKSVENLKTDKDFPGGFLDNINKGIQGDNEMRVRLRVQKVSPGGSIPLGSLEQDILYMITNEENNSK